MKRALSYLLRHAVWLLLSAAFVLIFVVIAALYGRPMYFEGLLYASGLCLFLALVAAGVGFARYARRCRTVESLQASTALRLDELPPPRDALEEAYQALVRQLCADAARQGQEAADQREQMMEYYTLWAHQIKSPVAAMQLMLRPEDEALRAQVFRVDQYVNMALAYLRTDSQSTDFVFRQCSLEKAARACVRKYAPLFIRAKVRVQVCGEDTKVLSDEKWLCFLIEQVLSNAIKYTPEGGSVTISIAQDALTVSDTGIGIAPEDLPRVFDKGFTGENGRLDKRATGVGLYLVSRVAGKLGHTVTLTSVQGEGTTVRFGFEMTPIAPD